MTESAAGSATRLPDPKRRTRLFLVVFLVVFINLPAVHSSYYRWKVGHSDTTTVATVTKHEVLGGEDDPHYWIAFRYPDEVEDDGTQWSAQVDRETYDAAAESGEIEVRYLEGRTSAYEVPHQVRGTSYLVLTGVADAALLIILLLARRYGGRRRPLPLRIAAIGDVERCAPGGAIEQVEGDLYLVRGEVSEIDDGEIVLDLGDRDVVVVLDGHTNPVGYQQPAQVRGRLLS